jgi:uncharacterized protein YaiI (UPF0178 family)
LLAFKFSAKVIYQKRSRDSRRVEFWCVEEMADDKNVEKTISEDLVVTKYKMAGEIVNSEFCQINL